MKTACVIGAGPAGLSAAIGLSRSDYQVTVWEQRPLWQGRVCGGFINSEAVRHLKWLGVWNQISIEAVPISETKVTFGNNRDELAIAHYDEVGIPRKNLEETLIRQAQSEGVEIKFGQRFKPEGNPTADLIVISSGRGLIPLSAARSESGPAPRSPQGEGGWYGWNAQFKNANQRAGQMSIQFYSRGYVGTLTHADGTTNVCGLVQRKPNERPQWDSVFEEAKEKSHGFLLRLGQADRISEWRAVGPLPYARGRRHSFAETYFVGDAAAVGDPYMGEGIGRALSAGPMIYDALSEQTSIEHFNRSWLNAYDGRFRVGRTLRWLLEHPFWLFIFGKSLGARSTAKLWRHLNDYGYKSKNLSRPKFREMLSV